MVQSLGQGVGTFSTAALLYGGAALVAWALKQPAAKEAGLRRSDLPRLLAMAGSGAVIGPVALVWGLQHTSGSSASLMLTLEAVFTAVLAWRWYGETLDKRVILAVVLMLLATVAWGVDNTLSRGVADRDPGQVVLIKAALGTTFTFTLAFVFAESAPSIMSALGLVLVGATGYGLSLRLYLLAQRSFGAARTGSVFAFAPFIGALGAFALGDRSGSWLMITAGCLMLLGVVLHLMENHAHEHTHEELVHEHAHRHDDGHHDHWHDPMPMGAHSHAHRHTPITHTHAHVPDLHHGHHHAN